MIYDFEELTAEDKMNTLLAAKEILRSLHDEHADFPYETYWNGTAALAAAAAWVDNTLILPNENGEDGNNEDAPYPFPPIPEVEEWKKQREQQINPNYAMQLEGADDIKEDSDLFK